MRKNWPVYLAALSAVALHYALIGRYNFQRDELYFIACGNHLDWGYVDIGPLAMWLSRLSREIFGDTLFGFRFFSPLAHGATILLVGAMAGRMGAGTWGRLVAALSVLIAPVWLGSGNVIALSSFEPVIWATAAWFVLRVIQTGDGRYWLGVGAAAGIGLLNKPAMLFFGLGLVVALAATPMRRHFRERWLYLAGALALLIASPYILWQLPRDWPTLQFMVGLNREIMSRIPAPLFVLGQFLYLHPLNAVVWIAGLVWCFRSEAGCPYRAFGWIFVTVFLFLLIAKSKIYYLAPAYVMLFPPGAVALESWARARRAFKPAWVAAMLLGGAVLAPVCLPIFAIERADAYITGITFGALKNAYEVTGTFHDQFGWEEQTKAVADVYHALPPQEKAQAIIFGTNFGRAGALDFYGPKYGLPPAYGFHQNYFFWGPPPEPVAVAVVIGSSAEELGQAFNSVTEAARAAGSPHAMNFEQNLPIYICREPKVSFQQLWPTLRADAFSNG